MSDPTAPAGPVQPTCATVRIHDLKVWPEFFEKLLSGEKTFEVRKDDRGFIVGDWLCLREYVPFDREPARGGQTGRKIERVVSYLLRGPAFGIERGHVVMGLAFPPDDDPLARLRAENAAQAGMLGDARDALNRDRTGLAAGLNKVRGILDGYEWLAAGEWGSYDYTQRTEKTLRDEIGWCLEAARKQIDEALAASGRLADEHVRRLDTLDTSLSRQLADARAESATLREKLAKAEQEVERANAAETLMHGECATAWSKASTLEKQLTESRRAQEAARAWIIENPPRCQCDSGAVESATCPHYEYGDLLAQIDRALKAAARSAPTPDPSPTKGASSDAE